MKTSIYSKVILASLFLCLMISCEDFVEGESPDHKIISEVVFNDDETAISTMTGIYNQLFRASFSGGRESSVHVLAGLSADELESIRDNEFAFLEFQFNEILPDNSRNFSLWSSAYNIIYMANSILTGLEKSDQLTESVRKNLEGEAKFIRAFSYFYLVNLFGEVPIVLTTDYRINSQASRKPVENVYQQIVLDLTDSRNLLSSEYGEGGRTRVNQYAATALLARVHLYNENWEEAERMSTQVIERTETYELLDDLNMVFLSNSREAIWQISPIGNGGVLSYTNEAATFLFHPFIPSLTKLRLTNGLVNTFEAHDLRLSHWIGFHQGTSSYFSHKYKDRSSMNNISEYSMVLRLSEQYLIRAEARARLNNLDGAFSDIDVIRTRAGLEPLAEISSDLSIEELLDVILEERKRELFTEWGHRWLDLKRTGNASEILSNRTSYWSTTDLLYPIPAEDLIKNANLEQNPGY